MFSPAADPPTPRPAWMAGAGKKVIAYIPDKQDPELMYKMFDCITESLEEVIAAI